MSRHARAFAQLDREREERMAADNIRMRALLEKVAAAGRRLDFHQRVQLHLDDVEAFLKEATPGHPPRLVVTPAIRPVSAVADSMIDDLN